MKTIDFLKCRRVHPEDHFGVPCHIGRDHGRTSLTVRGVEEVNLPRSRLYHHVVAEGDQLANRRRCRRHTCLSCGGLPRNPDTTH